MGGVGGSNFMLAMTPLVTLILVATRPLHVGACPSTEWASLMAFKASLNNNLALFHSWRGTNCCYRWYGISCDPTTRRVAEVTLRALTVADDHHHLHRAGKPYMSGHISPSLCNLTQLSSITISDWKGISGTLPRCITTLRYLQILDLSGNLLSGEIPRDVGRLTQLTVLNLADNRISGSIPRSLVNLSNLMQLDLRNNAIQGPIPSDLGRLKRLNRALLSHNQISGPIPRSISEIYGLADLDLSLNRLSGSIPASLGRMRVLDSLKLKYNNLTGRIPWALLGSRMSHLDLSRNALSGPIPDAFGGKSYFINLDLSHNILTGSVAKSMVDANYIGYLDLSHNRLCGRVPRGAPFNHLHHTLLDHNRCLCGIPLKPCTHK